MAIKYNFDIVFDDALSDEDRALCQSAFYNLLILMRPFSPQNSLRILNTALDAVAIMNHYDQEAFAKEVDKMIIGEYMEGTVN